MRPGEHREECEESRWPPEPSDLDEAETVCRELGLGTLLDRMPAGIMQMVGETGWRLSHGERSRLFVARALLHGAPLVVLDESFGALDASATRFGAPTGGRGRSSSSGDELSQW